MPDTRRQVYINERNLTKLKNQKRLIVRGGSK